MSNTKAPIPAGLFGQKHSSRDYTKEDCWGKNQFNSSFPASLLAYMSSKSIKPVYLKVDEENNVIHDYIEARDVLGIDPLDDNAFYKFEAGFPEFEKYYTGDRENIDLVMVDLSTNKEISGLEVKLTTLPDNTTCNKTESEYSCEIVVRPPTICFLACSICSFFQSAQQKAELISMLNGIPPIIHWDEASEVAPHYDKIEEAVLKVSSSMVEHQSPLIIQPVWKTEGKKGRLSDDCLDIFVWSNLAVIQMCRAGRPATDSKINRFQRSIIWLYKMLFDYAIYGQFDYVRIIKNHSYGNANDKAFSLLGNGSHKFLSCDELTHPRIKKNEIKFVILGGGQELLSPERRFDAILVNSPDIFNESC